MKRLEAFLSPPETSSDSSDHDHDVFDSMTPEGVFLALRLRREAQKEQIQAACGAELDDLRNLFTERSVRMVFLKETSAKIKTLMLKSSQGEGTDDGELQQLIATRGRLAGALKAVRQKIKKIEVIFEHEKMSPIRKTEGKMWDMVRFFATPKTGMEHSS